MKTNAEYIAMAKEKHMQFVGAERVAVCELLDACRRETWDSATKAQIESFLKSNAGFYDWTPVPFPSQEVKP